MHKEAVSEAALNSQEEKNVRFSLYKDILIS